MQTAKIDAADTAAVREALDTFSKRVHPPCEYPEPRAAVLIGLRLGESGEFEVLLTERSKELKTHAGEVALPGGKMDKSDADIYETALREAEEEVGLEQSRVHILGHLESFVSKHLILVTPVVAMIPNDFVPKPDPAEVSRCFFVPLSCFTKEENHRHTEIPWLDSFMRLHFVEHEGTTIWGLTAIVILTFLEALNIHVEYDIHIPGVPTYAELSKTYSKI